jgi:hypothetical protein
MIGSDDESEEEQKTQDIGAVDEEGIITEDKPPVPASDANVTKLDDLSQLLIEREWAAACYHRLPAVGRLMLLDQFPAYFKIEQLIVPQVKSRRKPTGFFAKWWKSSSTANEATAPVLEPRFLAFEEGYLILLNYCPELPKRNYGAFEEEEVTAHQKPLPELEWNAEVTVAREMFDLDEIHLANFNMVSALEDPHENYLIVELLFSRYKLEQRPESDSGVEEERRDETIAFNIEFADLEDFIAEVRL